MGSIERTYAEAYPICRKAKIIIKGEKIMKRIVSIVLLACLLCGLFAGCKAKKQANSATDVEVIYWETGYGRAWLDL